VWEQYRWQIALTSAILLAQGSLISILLFEGRRRRAAEAQSRQRSAELAHINGYAIAGDLTATIAHELNQLLGSILTNTETAESMFQSPRPLWKRFRKYWPISAWTISAQAKSFPVAKLAEKGRRLK
jgi:signal transduction histidine kinase